MFFSVYGCMLCSVHYLFVISTSVIDCLERFVSEMTYYVSSGTLNITQLNSTHVMEELIVVYQIVLVIMMAVSDLQHGSLNIIVLS